MNFGPTREALQDKWVGLVDKGFADYRSLSPDERIWFNVEGLIGQVDNGGLVSFYYNHIGERAAETIEDLETLGAPEIADLLKRMNSLFPGGRPSLDINDRNAAILDWPDEYRTLMESWDKVFYACQQDLWQKLMRHILASGLDR